MQKRFFAHSVAHAQASAHASTLVWRRPLQGSAMPDYQHASLVDMQGMMAIILYSIIIPILHLSVVIRTKLLKTFLSLHLGCYTRQPTDTDSRF